MIENIIFKVRVQPRAKKTEIKSWEGENLRVSVKAAPVNGAANRAVLELLAEAFQVEVSRLEILTGHTSRNKTIRVNNVQ